jgi:hypothetical protein
VRGERNAIVHSITCRSGPNCGMLSFHPGGECSCPITFAGSFYLRAGLVGSKAQCSGGRARTRRKSQKRLAAAYCRSGNRRRERAHCDGSPR